MDRNSQRTERIMEFTGVFGATGIIKVSKSLLVIVVNLFLFIESILMFFNQFETFLTTFCMVCQFILFENLNSRVQNDSLQI